MPELRREVRLQRESDSESSSRCADAAAEEETEGQAGIWAPRAGGM